ncbi:SLIT-ROBO Rho GTPase-activating protein 3, variant 2 [Clonorchis sinensis]|uniref:SLIT-ROBO Rho GTPase-activating protein 3, variant 2 n=1 Tax=Clonorchis sinensis TaxID=79923 RepID=A0A8T1MDM7_CLOSI|nr:SLIT-ROBO Rho GTPase-activating protein 3, variant 2 [Clonorchis sinensis]
MDYSCGLGPHLGGSLRRSSNIRRSISSSKYIGGIDWHLRTQFIEQSKCLDLKLDIDCTVLAELQEFYRRRAVVEQDYADALAKLANTLKQRHANETAKRPHWAPYTTTTILNTLLGSTLRLSEAHSTLADLFAKQMVQRLADMDEDAVRLHKQCREMMSCCQDRVLSNTAKLQADLREYMNKQTATIEAGRVCRRFEDKLTVSDQKARSKGKDPTTSQRYLRSQKEFEAKQQVYTNATLATARARNDYLLQLAATNHSVARYFTEEAPDIIDCLACGFHNSLARSAMMHLSCEEALKSLHGHIVEMFNRNITALDWRRDKACFFKYNEHGFTRPGAFVYVPCKEDTESQIRADGVLREELETAADQLSAEIDKLRASTEETWKTLEHVEKSLLELINQKDCDVSQLFVSEHPRRRRSVGASSITNGSSAAGGSSGLGSSLGTIVSNSSTSSSPVTARGPSPISGGKLQDQSSGGRGQTPSSPAAQSSGENPSGMYLALRSAYREARIEQEKFYLERFAFYTQEVHRCQVLQVRLAEIRRALAATQPASHSAPENAVTMRPISNVPYRYAVPVLPTASTGLPASKGRPQTDDTSEVSFDLAQSPPPPPPAPQSESACRLMRSKVNLKDKSLVQVRNPEPVTQSTLVQKPHKTRRVLQVPNVGKPKLFGGTIDEYVEATKQPIPCILLSCTRAIVQFGMHQQGIFRVSASQTEINEFKAAFEEGFDPLIDAREARDINSAAGLLKLYFRELGEPPFPHSIFKNLIECTNKQSDMDETARRLRQVVIQGLSRPVFIVMRFLFAFLKHVSEHADENSMDAYNLAVCFGPTLMPIPTELLQVHQQTSVIELIKTFITHHAMIFDPLVPGPVYMKHVLPANSQMSSSKISTPGTDSNRSEDLPLTYVQSVASEVAQTALRRNLSARAQSPTDVRGSNLSEDTKSSSNGDLPGADLSVGHASSMDELDRGTEREEESLSADELRSISDSEASEAPYTLAVAQADFVGTTPRELSFQQGDEIVLYRRLNKHWWDGQLVTDLTGTRGLVPHLYVVPKTALACLSAASDEGQLNQSQMEEKGESLDASDESADLLDIREGSTNADGKQQSQQDLLLKASEINYVSIVSELASKHNAAGETIDQKNVMNTSVYENMTEPHTSSVTVPVQPQPCQESVESPSIPVPSSGRSHSTPTTGSFPANSPITADVNQRRTESIPSLQHSSALRHTVSCSLSGQLSTLPEDEAITNQVTFRASPVCRHISSNVPSAENEAQARFLSHADIDNQLAEFMRNLNSLERADTEGSNLRTMQRARELSRKFQLPCPKHTPDLVMDLPLTNDLSVPRRTGSVQSTLPPNLDSSSADHFAEQGVDTMRKRPEQRQDFPASETASSSRSVSKKPSISVNPDSRCLFPTARPLEDEPKRISIADRVAAFEASSPSSDTPPRLFPRPAIAPKPPRE